jgi:hypothetical protein
MKKRKKKRAVCMTEGCTSRPITRGLCAVCYKAVLRSIKGGGMGTTWAKLFEAGLAKPERRIARQRRREPGKLPARTVEYGYVEPRAIPEGVSESVRESLLIHHRACSRSYPI